MNLRWTPMCRFLGFLALVLSVAAEPAHAQRGDADAAYGDVQAGRILPLGRSSRASPRPVWSMAIMSGRITMRASGCIGSPSAPATGSR
ncbi:hypothetical protein E6W36_05755 [Hankyongella ginsenosidimutans]|uniref:Uncharacterized protein n=1 Tax=Hankyongella ginsenosidimutans TaxID=1763828 RepID=A0A4D7C651_9SPHN|nr:hypothetical protein [Hankyongella ginsenosidimutans]QCI79240.1 hypothetical protein E6W36_05755 [Hankyongella ginsenosidimutans]